MVKSSVYMPVKLTKAIWSAATKSSKGEQPVLSAAEGQLINTSITDSYGSIE
jgi:hypothetical protein